MIQKPINYYRNKLKSRSQKRLNKFSSWLKNPKKFNLIKKMKKKFPSRRKRFHNSKEKGWNQDNNDCLNCLINRIESFTLKLILIMST